MVSNSLILAKDSSVKAVAAPPSVISVRPLRNVEAGMVRAEGTGYASNDCVRCLEAALARETRSFFTGLSLRLKADLGYQYSLVGEFESDVTQIINTKG